MASFFDEVELNSRIEKLSLVARAAFAAGCATRLIGLYEKYSRDVDGGDPGAVRRALDTAWAWVCGDPQAAKSCKKWIEELTELLPDEELAGAPPGAGAEDAIASAIFALQAITLGDPQYAVWAAERGINAATDFVRHRWMHTKGQLPTPKEGFEDAVVSSLLGQMEQDLLDLEGAQLTLRAGPELETLRLRAMGQQVPGE